MNIGSLAALGKIAGIGGIALGVVALIFGKLVGAVAGVPADERAATVQIYALLFRDRSAWADRLVPGDPVPRCLCDVAR